MLPFAESFSAIVLALVLPTFIGLSIMAAASRFFDRRYLVAYALGIYLWFFSDTMGDSSYLDVNSAFAGGERHLALLMLFAGGLILVFSLDRSVFKVGPGVTGHEFAVPLLVAFAVGIHGFGEGAAFSATAASTQSTSLFDAFGGVSAEVAFILHKCLEPMMIGAAYAAYARNRLTKASGLARDILILTIVFTLPGIIGGATDYSLNYETSYFFALGLGTSIYVPIRLVKPLFWDSNGSSSESVVIALAVLFGFLCIYFAALFHS